MVVLFYLYLDTVHPTELLAKKGSLDTITVFVY